MHCRMCSSNSGLYLIDDSSNSNSSCDKHVSTVIGPRSKGRWREEGNKIALVENHCSI